MCQGSFNGVSEGFKEVSRKFQEFLKKVSRAFLDNSLKGVSRKTEGYFEGDSSGFLRVFEKTFKGMSGNFKDVSRNFQG